MFQPFVTVGIITKNEEKHIAETLRSVLDSSYPKSQYEILIVDGNSTDNTQNIINDFAKKHKNIRLILEPWGKGTHGKARNLISDNAKGKYLATTDGDCLVDKEWLKTLVEKLHKEHSQNKKIIACGGIRRPIKTKKWKEDLLNNMLYTFLGSGGSQGFVESEKKYIDSIPNYNSIYLTSVVKKVRYSTLGVGEDYEFNIRLNQLGYKIVFSADAKIYHHQSDKFSDFFKQMYNYGKAQIQTYRRIKHMRYFAILAGIFSLGILIGPILSLFNQYLFYLYATGISLYFFIALFYTGQIFYRTKKIFMILAVCIFPLQHYSYGLGVLIETFFGKQTKL